MTKAPSRPDLDQRSVAISRAEKRLGFTVPECLIGAAEKLTAQKVKVKGLPADYFPLLLEDEIVDACVRVSINKRCTACGARGCAECA